MGKYDLLRHVCFLNDVEIDGSIARDSKRLPLEVSWPCVRRCGATKMSNVMLCEHHSACDMYGDLHSACPVSVALFIQFLLQAQRHLSKLFDNLAKMKFQLDSEQKPTKVGLGMYSREEEYVSFSEPCDCSGQVRGRPCLSKLSSGVCPPAPCGGICCQDVVELCYSSFMRKAGRGSV